MPLLRWLLFTGVCVFGAVLLWYFGSVAVKTGVRCSRLPRMARAS